MVKRGRLTRWFAYHSILFQICSRGTNKQGAEEKEVKRKGAEEKEGGQKKGGPARQKDCFKDTFEKEICQVKTMKV